MVQGAAATIEVYHDLICPWCFIGKRRFEIALSHHRGAPVVVRWQPFLLNPNMPSTGMDQRNYLALKFGGPRRAQQAHEMIARTARMDDLSLRLDAIERTPPTLDAHRFIAFVSSQGVDTATAIDAVFSAFFQGGRNIGDVEVLESLGCSLGVAPGRVRSFLGGDDLVDTVRASDWSARQMGIQAVPCFVFQGRYALSGAQDPDAFQPLLDLLTAAA